MIAIVLGGCAEADEEHPREGSYDVVVPTLPDGTCATEGCGAGTDCNEAANEAAAEDGICDPAVLEVISGPDLVDGACEYSVYMVEGDDC